MRLSRTARLTSIFRFIIMDFKKRFTFNSFIYSINKIDQHYFSKSSFIDFEFVEVFLILPQLVPKLWCYGRVLRYENSLKIKINSNHPDQSSASAAAASPSPDSIHSYEVWSLSHWMIPSAVLSPLKSIGGWDLSLPQNLRVGNPWISTAETSFSVESTLAITMLGLLASLSAASSKCGAMVLQCPHHGA